MMSINLLELFPSILVPILAEWSYDRDICCLDTAVCNNTLRPMLMSILPKCFVSHFKGRVNRWFAIRGMGVRRFFPEAETLNDNERIILSNSTYIDFIGKFPALSQVLDFCPVIRSIKLIGNVTDSEVLSVIPRIHDLVEWDADCPKLTHASTTAIVDRFPLIKHIGACHDISETIKRCQCLESVESKVCNSATYTAIATCESVTVISFYHDFFEDNLKDTLQLTDTDGIKMISNRPHLKVLKLRRNKLTNVSIMRLGMCHMLKYLQLGNAQITDEGLHTIGKGCPLLAHLQFSSPLVTNAGVISIAHGCPQIWNLCIYCDGVGDAGILALLRFLTKLRIFKVACASTTDLAYMSAFDLCPSLRCLNICLNLAAIDVPFLIDLQTNTSQAIVSNVRDMDKLVSESGRSKFQFHRKSDCFTIHSIVTLCSASIQLMLMQNSRLVEVSIDEVNFDEGCMQTLARCCPLLTNVTLSGGTFSYDAFMLLLEKCSLLKEVTAFSVVDWTKDVIDENKNYGKTPSGLKQLSLAAFLCDRHCLAIASKCQFLDSISLQSCTNITNTGAESFIRSCPMLVNMGLSYCANDLDRNQIFQAVMEVGRAIDVDLHYSYEEDN